MAAMISSSVRDAIRRYVQTRSNILTLGLQDSTERSIGRWDDQMGRLKMWAGNIGAHQTGQSSLENRLRDASHIRDQIIELLKDICDVFSEVEAILLEQLRGDESDSSSDSDQGDSLDEDLAQLLETFQTCVNGLFTMSLLVRKPVKHDFLKMTPSREVAAFEPFDKEHVRNKFPQASEPIVERLGLAITRRRHYLRYRDRHQAKLNQGLIEGDGPTGRDLALSATTVTTVAKVQEYEDNRSEASDATTVFLKGSITIPPIPKGAEPGIPFVCPYCFVVICPKNHRGWEKHIFQDLQPYICTFQDCPTPAATYATRREWVSHMIQSHRDGWVRKGDIKDEIEAGLQCSLCASTFGTENEIIQDVATHLQELALFVLPRYDDILEESDEEAPRRDSDDDLELPPGEMVLHDKDSGNSSSGGDDPLEDIAGRGAAQLLGTPTDGPNRISTDEGVNFSRDEATPLRARTGSQDGGQPEGILKQVHDAPEQVTGENDEPRQIARVRIKKIPPNARWTRISRRVVSAQSLEEAGLRFEDYADYVIVLRVLTYEEIVELANRTFMIRASDPQIVQRQKSW